MTGGIKVEYAVCNLCGGCGGYAVLVSFQHDDRSSLRVLGGAKSTRTVCEVRPGTTLYNEAVAALRAMATDGDSFAAHLLRAYDNKETP